MSGLCPPIKFALLDSSGNPAAGYLVYTYAAGTSTPKDSYTTQAASVANTNPVVLDSRGEATIWLSGAYKIVVKTPGGSTVYEDDNISDGALGATFTNTTLAGTLTVSGASVTWSGNPTHSGNHTFTGNVTVNGNTQLGNASGDTLTVYPNAVTWQNNPTHSGNHAFSGDVAFSGKVGTESTFTPAGIAGTPTYTTQVGKYTKQGNLVTFGISMAWTGGTNGSSVSVTGLPFTASSAASWPCTVIVNDVNNSFTWTGTVVAYVQGGTTTILVNAIATGASAASLLNPNAGTKDMKLFGTYFT
jgi:hypothetical protein